MYQNRLGIKLSPSMHRSHVQHHGYTSVAGLRTLRSKWDMGALSLFYLGSCGCYELLSNKTSVLLHCRWCLGLESMLSLHRNKSRRGTLFIHLRKLEWRKILEQ